MSLTTIGTELIDAIIEEYGEIKRLNLSNNGLYDISNISRLSSLEKLNLSHNDLVDIRCIGLLSNMSHLNLSNNNIFSIDCLINLKKLEFLDISHNKLASIVNLKCLENIPAFRTLYLKSNPLSNTLGYPSSVYSILPNLVFLDEIDNTPPEIESADEPPRHVEEILSLNEDKDSLIVNQIDILKNLLNQQDEVISNKSGKVPNAFPVQYLLKLWRDQVLKLNINSNILSRKISLLYSSNRQNEQCWAQSLEEKDSLITSLRERFNALELNSNALKTKIAKLEHELASSNQNNSNQTHQNKKDHSSDKFKFIVSTLLTCKRQLENDFLDNQMKIHKCIDKFNGFNDRLHICDERILFIKEIFNQKNLQYRNSIAAFTAEKEIWRITNAIDIDSIESKQHTDFSSFSMRPEAETFMRTIFRHLDPEDTGLCIVDHLLYFFNNIYSKMQSSTDFENTDLIHSDFFSVLLMNGISIDEIKKLIDKLGFLRDISDENSNSMITWGEFLYLFTPGRIENLISSKTADRSFVKDIELFSDFNWGFLPINIDDKRLNYVLDNSNCYAKLDLTTLRSEAFRLSKERSFILKKLQDNTKSFNRRINEVCHNYQAKIMSLENTNNNLCSKINDLNSILKDQKEKTDYLELSLNETKAKSSTDIQNCKNQIKILEEKLILKEFESSKLIDKTVCEERGRTDRLEAENNLLKKELNKAEIKAKSYQRDVVRLQVSLDESTEKISNMQDVINKLNNQLNLLQVENQRIQEIKIAIPHIDQTKYDEPESQISPKIIVNRMNVEEENENENENENGEDQFNLKSSSLLDLKMRNLNSLAEKLLKSNSLHM